MWKDSETELDFLDYDYLIQTLQNIIMDDSLLPASIGVYGDWGSGKSSLMNMCKKKLEKQDPHVKCLVFNGWLFENYEDAKTAILGTILDEIGKEKRLTKKAKNILKGLYESVDKLKLIKGALKYGTQLMFGGEIGALSGLAVDTLVEQAKSGENIIDSGAIKEAIIGELNDKALREDIRKFQNEFAQLLDTTKISRLVVFVDELDRCRPDTILDTLEAIKLFLFKGNVAFVIGADERHIAYAVKSKFADIEGIQIDIGKEYLEKLVQYPVRIPRLDADEVETYIACLLLQSELPTDDFERFIKTISESKKTDYMNFSIMKTGKSFTPTNIGKEQIIDSLNIARQLSEVLSSGLHGNPRQCKRFLNSLYMRLDMAKFKNVTLDRKVLAKIMLLEYIKPAIFNEMAKMAFSNKLKNELEIAEAAKDTADLSNLPTFKRWKDDQWFLNWCSTDPQLATTDLTAYFYFTRTSLDERVSRISTILSPKAQTILQKLFSKADVQIRGAINDSRDLSDSEVASILKLMFERMSAETKVEKEHLRAFIKLAASREIFTTDALDYLRSFTGNQIPISANADICNFAVKARRVEEIQDIIRSWGITNSDLQHAMQSYLETRS